MRKLLTRCWSDDPSERPTFSEIFDELSSDMSYFNETVDEEEIQYYLEMLEISKERRNKIKNKDKRRNDKEKDKIESLENELKKLKLKLKKIQNEKNKSGPSDCF